MGYTVMVVMDNTMNVKRFSYLIDSVGEKVCQRLEDAGHEVYQQYLEYGSKKTEDDGVDRGYRTPEEIAGVLEKGQPDFVLWIKYNNAKFSSDNRNQYGGVYMNTGSTAEKSAGKFIRQAFPIDVANNLAKTTGKYTNYTGCPVIKFGFGERLIELEQSGNTVMRYNIYYYLAKGVIDFLNSSAMSKNPNSPASSDSSDGGSSGGQKYSEPSYELMGDVEVKADYTIEQNFKDPITAGSIDRIYEDALPRIFEKQIKLRSDYLIYFDNVLMNDYAISYNTSIGVNSGMGTASVELIYTPAFRSIAINGTVEDGVENGTQMRIFVSNPFSGKYNMVFDGIIKQRILSRDSRGFRLTFSAVDYIYWMNKIIAPVSISFNEAVSPGERLKWKAQSVDPELTANVEISSAGSLKGKTVQEYFNTLKEKSFTNSKIYSETNSVANWDDVIDRVSIMGDINKELVKYQVMDFVVNSNSTFADTVYVSMSNTTNNLMMEFYQDRDGIVRIKPPFWNEPVLKNHVIDPLLIMASSENTDWSKMYTRIIVTGGVEEWMPDSGSTSDKIDILTPVGVYVGSLTGKDKAKWADYTSEGIIPSAYGTVTIDDGSGGGGGSENSQNAGSGTVPTGWIYPMKKKATAEGSGIGAFGADRNGGKRKHAGIDLIQSPGIDVVACASGTVKLIMYDFIDGHDGTNAVFVHNDDGFWILYGEIKENVSVGNKITKGQVIGKTLKNKSGGGCMVHFEVYKGNFTGSDSYDAKVNSGFLNIPDKAYARRNDLLDPSFIKNAPIG